MPALRPKPSLTLLARQRWSRIASILGALFVAAVLLSALFSNVRAAPRVMEARASTESANAHNAGGLFVPPQQPANVWTICASGCHFTLIEQALDDASVVAGDTLLVMDAVHTESDIDVDKDVVIRGQGAGETIVQAASTLPEFPSGAQAFRIMSGTVATISDMTIRYGATTFIYVAIAHSSFNRDDDNATAIAWAGNSIRAGGAGISVDGDLFLENTTVSDNFVFITSTAHAVATATAPITATASAHAWAFNDIRAAGAGIYNSGNLTVTGSTIADNNIYAQDFASAQVEANGGVITESAVATNTTTLAGAGIYNEGSLWLSNSTVSGNLAHASSTAHAGNEVELPSLAGFMQPASFFGEQAVVRQVRGTENAFVLIESDGNGHRVKTASDKKGLDGALPDRVGTGEIAPRLTVDGITVSASIESRAVAGIYNAGTATIRFSTISDNSAVTEADISGDETTVITDTIGGIFNETGAELSLNSTLIASQAQGADCAQTADSSHGYNLDSDGSCALSATGDQSNVEAMIGPLGDNGGPTPTHAPLFGSPALNAADPICPTASTATDQRDVSRPAGSGPAGAVCDVGAVEAIFEADLNLEKVVVGQTQIDGLPGNTFTETVGKVTAGARLTYTFSVRNDGPDGAPGVLLQQYLPVELVAAGATVTTTKGSCDPDLPADGSEPLQCDLGNLLPDEVISVTVGARVSPSASDGAILQSEASLSSAAVDAQADNDSVQLFADVNRRADVTLTKRQTPALAYPGEVLTYVVSIENRGPSDAPPVTIADMLPDGLQNASWTCVVDGDAACAEASGSGSISETLELPAASAVRYTISAQVSACVTIENTALASNTLDPYPDNNDDTAVNRPYCVFLLPLLGNPSATVENQNTLLSATSKP